ncbi:MAG: hypothetical protein LLF86_02970 [Nitrospiraceae bacterium]|nr:hypothetical protein [Nitrospiraceae bacterium]
MRIEKHYQKQIPINVETLIRKLLSKVPKEHLIGLGSIILVDHVSHRRNIKSDGLYWPSSGQDSARIEIALGTLYKGMPRIVFYLPFITKFMLAGVLYHEIGHHYQQQLTYRVSKKGQEPFAQNYKKKMLKKAFFWWMILLRFKWHGSIY